MPPEASSSRAPLAILAKAKIAKRPKITHGIKRPDERFMMKGKLAHATSGCESAKGRAAASNSRETRQFTALPARERRRPHRAEDLINNIRQYMSYKIAWCWVRFNANYMSDKIDRRH